MIKLLDGADLEGHNTATVEHFKSGIITSFGLRNADVEFDSTLRYGGNPGRRDYFLTTAIKTFIADVDWNMVYAKTVEPEPK